MKKLIIVLMMAATVPSVSGQTSLDYFLPDNVSYNKSIPAPASYLGHEVGEWHVTHDKLVGYMKLLADVSDRAVWEEYGKSWEGRPLGNLVITSEQNMKRLEDLRLEHLKLSDPASSSGLNTSAMPVVIKLGYGVHGNESSAQNSSLVTAYYLVAGEGKVIDNILNNAIILIDPALNPDGLQRHSTWVNMYRGMTLSPDPASREFNEAWPGGRTNHFWFDLNRDYIMLQQPETVGRVEAFFRWMPNVNTDHHEMGANSTFFFQPGVQSRNNPVVPPENQKMTAQIARYHARYLDHIGSLYYTEESFDDYYLGKGSAYPDAHGSVGILFEQAGLKGHLREVPEGIISFAFAIRNQFTVSLSTIAAAIDMKKQLLDMQRDFYTSALREADASPVKGYVFKIGDDRGSGAKFIENLLRHKIEVYRCGRSVTKNGESYGGSDSYYVPLRQKENRFIRSLFEPVFMFDDTVFYDISTWVLPMSFNISYSSITSPEATGMAGERVMTAPFPAGKITGEENAYAWLFSWNDFFAPRALYMIQKAGLTARVATRPFSLTENGKTISYGYGTIMVHAPANKVSPEEMRKTMESVAEECGIEIHGASTGLTSAGIDLGSNEFIPLTIPSVLLITDDGISSDEAGEIWYLLNVRYNMPVSMIPSSRLSSAQLSRYNVMIIAGNPSMPQQAVERIRDWNRGGGTLIAYKDGNRWAAENKFIEVSYIDNATLPEGLERKYSDRSADRALHQIPGSIFQTRIDLSHPLCYGYRKSLLPVFKSDAAAIRVTGNSINTPVRFTASPLLSGYCTPENLERIKDSAFAAVHMGTGRIISFYDDTNFRAIWFGTSRIFANAVFFGQILRPESRYGQ